MNPAIGAAAPAPISGRVSLDANGNGTADDPPAATAGVTISAHDDTGAVVGAATSGADGSYQLIPTVETARYRLEFTTLPAGTEPAPLSAALAGSTTQFVAAGATANLGLIRPTDACQNERLVVSCFMAGNPKVPGVSASRPAIVDLPAATANGALEGIGGARTVTTVGQVGAIYGIAPDPQNRGGWFAGAFVKRHAGLVADPGTIWRVAPTGGAPTLFTTVPAGSDPHVGTTDWLLDAGAWDAVGKVGLGDVELANDGTRLLVVNLFDRRVYSVPVANPAAATAIDIPRVASCADGDWRPLGLGQRGDRAYVGVVCTNQSTQVVDDNFRGYIFRTDPGITAFEPAPIFTFRLDYARGCASTLSTDDDKNQSSADNLNDADGSCPASTFPAFTARYEPWLPADPNLVSFEARKSDAGVYAHSPWISDVDFTPGGAMLIGLRSRFGDQTGSPGKSPNPAETAEYEGMGFGDALRACEVGGVWTLENNAACGGVTGAGADNLEGPGGGEFYNGDDTYWHDQTFMGAVAPIRSTGEVAFTGMDPYPSPTDNFDIGLNIGAADTGIASDRAVLLFDDGYSGLNNQDASYFGKANGLGALQSLCDQAPVEVGNRVWQDSDRDGVQDPSEPPLAGVTVELMSPASTTGGTVTDADGRYVFRGLQPGTGYKVTVAVGQAPLGGLALTVANTGASGAAANCGGLADSDATLEGTAAVIMVTTGTAGANNHSCDIGFAPPPNGPAIDLVPAPPTSGPVGEIGTVSLSVSNPGDVALTDLAITVTPPAAEGVPAATCAATSLAVGAATICEVSWPLTAAPQTVEATVEATAPGGARVRDTARLDFVGLESCLGDRVTLDADGDGRQDPAEAGLDNLQVTLLSATGATVATTTTDSSGTYLFCGLVNGDYSVLFGHLSGYQVSPRDVGGDDLDCDADPATGRTGLATVPAGGANLTVDGCFVALATSPPGASTTTTSASTDTTTTTQVAGVTASALRGPLPLTGANLARTFWLGFALAEFGGLAALVAWSLRRGRPSNAPGSGRA